MPTSAEYSPFLNRLNDASGPGAIELLGQVVERSDWLAARIAARRPFADVSALAACITEQIGELGQNEALELLRAHPELAPPAPARTTAASQHEQGRLQLLVPAAQHAAQIRALNRRYVKRHGYPFVIALHAQPSIDAVLARFEERLACEPEQELQTSLSEVVSVMTARLARLTRPSTPDHSIRSEEARP